MKAGIGPARTRKQFEDKLAKLDAKIAALEAGIEPYRREREMVLEMLAVHDRHHPTTDAAETVSALNESTADVPSMLKVRR
jgi:hypothetical protein